MEQFPILKDLSDSEVIAEVGRLVESERGATGNLIAAIGEMDARRLYLGQGCSSMFTYCTQVLHLAEHAAYNRIEAARAARKFPTILRLLADGRIHLSAVRLLAPHFTVDNHGALLEEASHKSKREVEQIVGRLLPRPDVRTSVRKVPSNPVSTAPVPPVTRGSPPVEVIPEPAVVSPPVQRPRAEPLAPGRYKLQFTVGEETYQKLRRAQDLLRHSVRRGDPAEVFDRALTLLLANLERTKFAATPRRVHAQPLAAGRDMCRPAFVARSGRAMAAAVGLRELPDDAAKPGCTNSIMSSRTRAAVPQRLRISSCAAPSTIGTKRSSVSACLFGSVRRSIRLSFTPELCPQAACSVLGSASASVVAWSPGNPKLTSPASCGSR